MTTVLPDGEYELELSDALWAQLLITASPSLQTSSAKRKNDEIFRITYDIVPTDIDDSRTMELNREEGLPKRFQIKAESTDDSDAVIIDGDLTQPQQLECVLVYNDKLKSFELQRIDTRLRTTGFNKIVSTKEPIKIVEPIVKPKVEPIPKKKRIKTETSIFQPKRAKTPLPTVPKTRRSPSVNSSDDELPLSKLTSPKKPTAPISKPSAPSPLNPSYLRDITAVDSRQQSPEKKNVKDSIVNIPTPSIPEPSSSFVSPVVSQELKPAFNQVSSKKPPSVISTPSIPQQSSPEGNESDEDDEFGALVDELEEELLSGDDFITVEEGEPEIKEKSYSIKHNDARPMNFRSLAGQSKDEDEVSSSEEE